MRVIPRVIPIVISLRVIEIKVSDLHWTPFCDVFPSNLDDFLLVCSWYLCTLV